MTPAANTRLSPETWRCRDCGGVDLSFDRSLCACGAMHYYCGDCEMQDDPCDDDDAPASKTPLPPEPDWIERLRSCAGTDEQGTFSVLYCASTLWPLLCDVAEQAERWSTFIPALASLRDEVERDA